MNRHNLPIGSLVVSRASKQRLGLKAFPLLPLAAASMLWAFFMAPDLHAQTVGMVAEPIRVTVPLNFSGSTLISNLVVTVRTNGASADGTGTNWIIAPINLSVSGAPSLPAGLSFRITDSNNVPVSAITKTMSIPTASSSSNIWLWVDTANVAEGVYTFSLDASGGATRSLLLTLQVAHIWTNTVLGTWSDSTSWAGGLVPSSASDVVFQQAGQISSSTATSVVVSVNTEIASLRFAHSINPSSQYQSIQIDPGATLSLTGTEGLSVLRDASDVGTRWFVNFFGDQGTLLVSNQNAVIKTFSQENQLSYIDMSRLGNFVVDADRIGICDWQVFPNYTNLDANGYSSASGGAALPRRMPPGLRLARTNVIKLNFPGDSNNYMDPTYRNYSFRYGNNYQNGTGSRGNLYFGISNAFYMDSICFVGAGCAADQSANIVFNPAFLASNCVAIFRNTNGGPMSVFAIGDGAGPGASGTGTKGQVNFNGGTVDAQVDRLYLGRERTNSSGAQAQGILTFSGGTFEANTAILGFQGEGTNQGTGLAYCQGTVNVSTTGVFRVNNTLELGYTTSDANSNSVSTGYGQISATAGGTVMANTILVGGVTKASANNTITLNASSLYVSNTIAGADKYLTSLSLNNGSGLHLFVDASATNSVIYTTNLVVSGSNSIVIEQINNLAPVAVPLITYVNPPSSALTPILPGGLVGALVDDGFGTIYLSIITNSPKNLIWRGYVSGDWDQSTPNWLDLDTGVHTNFVSGDSVVFDDGTAAANVNIADANMIVSGFSMTNSINTYVFSGAGNLIGTSPLTKHGSGTWQIDSKVAASIQVNEGTLTGSGIVGAITVGSGGAMSFGGTLLSLSCAGNGTLLNTASGSGLLSVSGICTNQGSFSGAFSVPAGGYLYNSGGLHAIGAASVDGTLVNNGTIGDDGSSGSLTINTNAVFEDTGVGSITLDTLTISAGATFIPGGDGIGTTTVYQNHLSGNVGLVRLLTGSTNIFKVNLTNSQPYTRLLSKRIVFGPSQGSKSINGATIVIENLGDPFTTGTLNLFANSDGGGIGNAGLNTTNSYPIINPPAPNYPALGLAWDVISDLFPAPTNPNNVLGGNIDIFGVAVNPVNVVFGSQFFNNFIYTNVTATATNIMTNNVIIANLQWPSDHTGWRLQKQDTTLDVGLTTNWVDVYGSTLTDNLYFTNVITTNAATFYRMVYP